MPVYPRSKPDHSLLHRVQILNILVRRVLVQQAVPIDQPRRNVLKILLHLRHRLAFEQRLVQTGLFLDGPVERAQQLVAQRDQFSAEPQQILLEQSLLRPLLGELSVGHGGVEGLGELRAEQRPGGIAELAEELGERGEDGEAGVSEVGAEVGEEGVDGADEGEREEFGFEDAEIQPVGGAVGVVAVRLEVVVQLGEIDRFGGEEFREGRLRVVAKNQREQLRLTRRKSGLCWDPW